MQKLWERLHRENRFRPKYPAEIVVQFVFRNFKNLKGAKVLDLGCGAGRHVKFMIDEEIDAYGVDISKEGIDYTKKITNSKIDNKLCVSSSNKLPFDDNFFDGIISYGVLYYMDLENIKKSIKEIHRILKKDGKAMLVVRNKKDYRFGKGKEIEKNTFIIDVNEKDKCAFNENNMIMHFFEMDEILELFKMFDKIVVDEIIETHENMEYSDANYIITVTK